MRPEESRPRYGPLDALNYPRFEGIATFMRLPHVTDPSGVDVAIVGAPFDTASFQTYCVELTQSFYLPSGNMTGYTLVPGSAYAEWTLPTTSREWSSWPST